MTLTMDPGYFRIYRSNGNAAQTTSRDVFVVPSSGHCGTIKFIIKVDNFNFVFYRFVATKIFLIKSSQDGISYLYPIKIIGEFFLAPDDATKSAPILVDGTNTISGRNSIC